MDHIKEFRGPMKCGDITMAYSLSTPVYLPLSSCIRTPGSFRPVGVVKDNRGKNAYSWKSQPEVKQEDIRSIIQVKFEHKGGEIPDCLRL